MSQRIVVLEVNEVPLRVYRHFAALRPGSNIARLLQGSQVVETLAQDVDKAFLYPSQTWASLNTGAPYREHQIHWYNDPKPAEYPLVWKTLAARGFQVGVVNTLHSSPAEPFAAGNNNFQFVIPDCFAPDSYTKPGYFEPLQSLNLKAVSSNSRVSSLKAPMQEAALTVLNSPRYGIRMQTMAMGASLVVQILAKKVNRERLRNLQFPLMGDVFLGQLQKHETDLAILFTNHVAGNMHRYWYGLFPGDYQAQIYDQAWVNKFEGEIGVAMDLLDAYVGELMRLVQEKDRILVVVSSMGQEANKKLTPEFRQERSVDYRLEDVKKFVGRLTKNSYAFKIESAMVPQYTLAFADATQASRAVAEMEGMRGSLEGINLELDQNQEVVTVSASLVPTRSEFRIGGATYGHKDLGFVKLEIEDHHSGCHCPEGSLIIYNSRSSKVTKPTIDYLEYTPALLRHFDIPTAPYMMEPSFSF